MPFVQMGAGLRHVAMSVGRSVRALVGQVVVPVRDVMPLAL